MKFNKIIATFCLSVTLASASVMARTVTDINGKPIDIPDNVQRIVNLWPANNQIVLMLGGANKLVGTVDTIKNNPWFAKVSPRISQVPVLTNGQTVQLEELLAAKPDVVLASSAAMIQEAERAGVKGVHVSFQDFEGLKRTVRITAEVIGDQAPQIAEEYIKELDSNLQFVKERLKDIKDEQRPVVLHIFNGSNLYKIDGGKSIIGEWMAKTGARNAFPEQANVVEVNAEEIVKANPDIIIVGSSGAVKGVEQIKNDPLWANISAVKNGKVFSNPLGTFSWDRYSGEEALQLLWAAKLFYPERFADVDMVKKTQAFYKKYYNYDLSTENAKRILLGLEPVK